MSANHLYPISKIPAIHKFSRMISLTLLMNNFIPYKQCVPYTNYFIIPRYPGFINIYIRIKYVVYFRKYTFVISNACNGCIPRSGHMCSWCSLRTMNSVNVTAQMGETPASDWQSLWRYFARGRLANAAVQAMSCTWVMAQG